MKNVIRLLAMLILGVILFTSCSAFSDLEKEDTKEPVFAYRPDLEWIPEGGGRFASNGKMIRYEVRLVEDESALYPVEVYVEGLGDGHYIPEAYLEELGWEVLSEDAWKHIRGGVEGRKYYAATADEIYNGFSVVDMLVASDVDDYDFDDVQVYVLQLEQKAE